MEQNEQGEKMNEEETASRLRKIHETYSAGLGE